jgi:hypothetical protein
VSSIGVVMTYSYLWLSIADWLAETNLTIWNAAIHCTLVVRNILIVSLR